MCLGCQTPAVDLPEPHEAVLGVIAELSVHLQADPYRFPPGRDAEGMNVFRLSLARVESLEDILDEEYGDVLAFARAECYERLGRWEEAAAAFAQAGAAGTSLSAQASVREAWARRIHEITTAPGDLGQLEEYITYNDAARSRLNSLLDAEPPPSPPYDAYLRSERENLLAVKFLYLFANRSAPRALDRAYETVQLLVEENRESHRAGEHRLVLGGFFEAQARAYAVLNPPTGGRFELSRWSGWIDNARAAYTEVARADGDTAKPEGQARLRALDAYAQSVLEKIRP